MREILFRAYDTYTKTMLPVVDAIKFTKSESINIIRDGAYGVAVTIPYQPHIELMQYTGLKDKNEKEIYEGDILQDSDCVYEVIFEYGCFDVKVIKVLKNVGTQKGMTYQLSFIISDNDNIKVIGNIYENLNLLEKENK